MYSAFQYALGTDSNPPPTPSTEPENEDTLDESDIADIERRISVNTASFQPKKGVPSPYAGWRLYFYDDGKLIHFDPLKPLSTYL